MRHPVLHSSPTLRRRVPAAILGIGLVLAGATACGSDDSNPASATDPSAAAPANPEAASLSITDPWIKVADNGMTAAFGTLVNDGDQDVVVTSATSEVSGSVGLHETVVNDDGSMAMQPKQGGFTVPAGGTHELAPGGDHLMVMDLKRPIGPGEKVIIKLTLEDGSTMEVDATAKDFSGADEKYQNGDMDMPDMGSDSGSDSGMEMNGQ